MNNYPKVKIGDTVIITVRGFTLSGVVTYADNPSTRPDGSLLLPGNKDWSSYNIAFNDRYGNPHYWKQASDGGDLVSIVTDIVEAQPEQEIDNE